MISFTKAGSRLCKKIAGDLINCGHDVQAYSMPKYAGLYDLIPLAEPLSAWTKQAFLAVDGIVFIGASGIAVRSIAPYLQDKSADPAIVVLDEAGNYAISLLSGHLGGANELAVKIAELSNGQPVITTATDLNHRFAVDVFAKKNNLYITNMKLAKEISAALLDGEVIGFVSDIKADGKLPAGIVESSKEKIGVYVGMQEQKQPFKRTLQLIPRIITIGIGCRKNTPVGQILETISSCLELNRLNIACVEQIASIDIKREEQGIIEAAKVLQVPFCTFTAKELSSLAGDYSESQFVKQVTGVDNICERSAVMASGLGQLIQRKTAAKGVTIALAIRDWSIHFE